jgi:2-polyprenyl-3-methyl-5-hydroxy-6-metoxy-1,4-benzoquinol methylase
MSEPCLICNGNGFNEKFRVKRTGNIIVVCSKCGVMQVNPRNNAMNFVDGEESAVREEKLDRLFNRMQEGSDVKIKDLMEQESRIREGYFRKKLEWIIRHKKGGKLLDVGCAQGVFLSVCSESGFEAYGVEPSIHTYKVAIENVPEGKVYNNTLSEAGLPESFFDVVTLFNTIEHLADPKGVVSEVKRILKPGGIFVVETPDAGHWMARIFGRRWIHFMPPDHMVFFSRETLGGLLSKAGFEVKEVKSSFKKMSLRLFLFHLSRFTGVVGRTLLKAAELAGMGGWTITIPQWDEMVVFAVKPDN